MQNLYISPSPHIKNKTTTKNIMADVIIALLPALISGFIIFGFNAIITTAISVTGCVLTEYISRKIMKKSNTTGDLSAIVTGLLLAMNLPCNISPLITLFGSVIAIGVVKQMFGGIGQNFVNPALTARIILLTSFPTKMTSWPVPFHYLSKVDSVTSATPLALNSNGQSVDLLSLFMGTTGGCIGETCAAALILGGIYLILKKVISPIIPLVYLSTVAIFTLILGENPVFHLLSGGLMLGAFFMATDYATSPVTKKGKVIFALGCGIITVLIRVFGSLPEGVSFSIVIMNILVPHIENLTLPHPFGKEK